MHQEGHIESGSGYSSGPTGGRTTNTSTNRTPFGSAGTDMGSGMMGDPTMGGRMLSGMTNGLMSGARFMSEPINTGSSGLGPNRPRRGVIGSAGTDMGSGMMGDPTMGGRMLSGMTNGLMSGARFMSEPINTGSGVTPNRPRRGVIGSAGTDMGSGMMGDPTNLGGGILGGVMGGGVMSSVMPQVGGITIVDETTPNLEMIQSFPVVSRDGNVHIHQDPNTGQMYQMTTEFHFRIPQIVASQKMMMSRNGTIGNITFGVMPPTGRRNRGRNLTIDLSIEDVTLLKDRYGPNNDTADPTCAIMRAYFNELNRNPNLDTPIYPCEGFPPGVTEQYVTVNYRISGQSNKTRIFRFFLDANGQCRCEIVNRIPSDFEDTGSGPTDLGDPTNLGGGILGGVMGGITSTSVPENMQNNYTLKILNDKFSQSPVFSTFTDLLVSSNLNNEIQPVISNSGQDFSQNSPNKLNKQEETIFESNLNLSEPKKVDLTRYTNLNLDVSSLVDTKTATTPYQTSTTNYEPTNIIYDDIINTEEPSNRKLNIKIENELISNLDTNNFTSNVYNQSEFVEINRVYPANTYANNLSEYSSTNVESSIPSITNSFTSIGDYISTFLYNNGTSNLPTNIFHNKY